MNCYEGLISIRGLCADDSRTKEYLDDLGISLFTASKAADEKFPNGKEFIESKINQAWKQVYNDITFKGLNANKILNDAEVGIISDDELIGFSGFNGVIYKLNKGCKLGRFYLYKVSVYFKTGGATTIKINQSGADTQLYAGTPGDDEVVEIIVNDFVDDTFKLLVDLTEANVYSGNNSIHLQNTSVSKFTVQGTDTDNRGQSFGITAEIQVRCDKSRYLCKYNDLLIPAVKYKAAALIYKEINDSNRFNDIIDIKQDKAIAEMAWLDSSFNLLQYDPAVERTYAPKGMYQKELEKINIPVPDCQCCMECNQDRYSFVLP